MFQFLKNEKFWLVTAGAVGAIIGGKILKSPTTRKIAVQGIAKGMMIQGDAKEALQNIKDEAEDICYEARQEAEKGKSEKSSEECEDCEDGKDLKEETDDEV